MTPSVIALLMVAGLLLAIFARAPIALAMGAVGAAGYLALASPQALLAYLSTAWTDKFMSYELAIVPLFILMGHLATQTGISAALFAAACSRSSRDSHAVSVRLPDHVARGRRLAFARRRTRSLPRSQPASTAIFRRHPCSYNVLV